jgi:hypothetical protein
MKKYLVVAAFLKIQEEGLKMVLINMGKNSEGMEEDWIK